MTEYAIYKGEEIKCIGTAEECAERLGIKTDSVKWMATPTAMKRFERRKKPSRAMVAVKLEEEYDR
ncbi:hypothetical protein QUW13_02780 [Enterococcus hirae]|nr:hypothetical protein [Enterococcus hirae]